MSEADASPSTKPRRQRRKKKTQSTPTIPGAVVSRPVWQKYGPHQRGQVFDFADPYLPFLFNSKTEREAVRELVRMAEERGFVNADDPDSPEDAYKFYRVFKGKALAMFVLPAEGAAGPVVDGFNIVGAHIDSPRLDLKPITLHEDSETKFALMKTHYYGGVRLYQWWSTPLALHGTILLADGTELTVSIGESPNDPIFTLPDLLPHLSRNHREQRISSGFSPEKMNVVIGSLPLNGKAKTGVLHILYSTYNITEEDLVWGELCFVPAGPAREVGLDRGCVGGYGQDDKSCSYATIMALLNLGEPIPTESGPEPETEQTEQVEEEGESETVAAAAAEEEEEPAVAAAPEPESEPEEVESNVPISNRPQKAAVAFFFDREEIGSDGTTGAKSAFFIDVLHDVARRCVPEEERLQLDMLALRQAFFNSRCISADVTAGMNPNWKEVHERMNAAKMGFGVSISKYTGSRGKVATNDASVEMMHAIRTIFNSADVPYQFGLLGKTNQGGGGTIAKYLAAYGIDVIDIGVPLLGMHSTLEVCHKADLYAAYLAYKAFFESGTDV